MCVDWEGRRGKNTGLSREVSQTVSLAAVTANCEKSAEAIVGRVEQAYSYAGTRRVSGNSIWNEARGVDHNEMGYYLYDGRGSVTGKTWYNGMVTDVYQYDPYGQVTLGGTGHKNFYGYNGESYSPNTGLEYLRARYYNANQGRFFQEDTYPGDIAEPLTQNRYAYVKNSPMNYVDPSGHEPYFNYVTGEYEDTHYEDINDFESELRPYKKLSELETGKTFRARLEEFR